MFRQRHQSVDFKDLSFLVQELDFLDAAVI